MAFEVNERLKDTPMEGVVMMYEEHDYDHNKQSILYVPPTAPNQESKSHVSI